MLYVSNESVIFSWTDNGPKEILTWPTCKRFNFIGPEEIFDYDIDVYIVIDARYLNDNECL